MCKTRVLFSLAIPIKRHGIQHCALSFAPSSPRNAFGSEERIVQLYQPN
jgi:hypothetical protein